jgi:hypothetical protein
MLPLKLCPEHYMFLLTESKGSNAGSLVPGARLIKSAPSTLRKEQCTGKMYRYFFASSATEESSESLPCFDY